MKITEFDLHSVEGNNILNYIAVASVTVTTGMWWWKNTSRRMIRQEYGFPWYFVDNGEYTAAGQVEALVRVWEAKNGKIFKK